MDSIFDRKRKTQRPRLAPGALLFVFVAFGFSQGSDAATREELVERAKKDGEVIVYASMNVEEVEALTARFQGKYPFVKVSLNRLGGERLLTKILAEARLKKSFADVVQTLGFSMHTLRKKGILGYYLSPESRFYPKAFKEDGYWTTVYTNPYVVAYNTRTVPREHVPQGYEDLLNPMWKGRMVMEGTRVDWFGGVLQVMGTERGLKYMKELSKQNIMLRTGHTLLAQLVAAGEAALDVNIPASSVDRLKKKDAPIDWAALSPAPSALIGIGVTSQPPHLHAAQLYVDFVLSKEGQQILSDFGRYLARSEFGLEQVAKKKGLHIVPVNPELGEKMDEYTKLMRSIFWK